MGFFDSFKKNNQKDSLLNSESMYQNGKTREFDLNVEKILENWEIYHAIREIIANALDEQILTNTKNIAIYEDKNSCWHITDYGRGLKYNHLTQNENEEKLSHDKLIGRFGVGLKDALATLNRHNVKVRIMSRYGIISLKEVPKKGFDDVITLHAEISSPINPNMVGTDFCLEGCSLEDIEKAKSLFLMFSGKKILEKNSYGEVLENKKGLAEIYINGVKVAEEPNFLFSYNITSLTSQLKKSLNRERTNVGRSAYTSRVKDILKTCKEKGVIELLVEDLQEFGSGQMHDELTWNDVAVFSAAQMRHLDESVTFISADILEHSPNIVDEMKMKGYEPIIIPANVLSKIELLNQNAKENDILPTAFQYLKDQQKNFKPVEVNTIKLTFKELEIYNKTDSILNLIGGKPKIVKEIVIAERFYESDFYDKTLLGLWVDSYKKIYIKRSQLKSINDYSGTLLHECVHAMSGATDVSREFELALTHLIGLLASKLI